MRSRSERRRAAEDGTAVLEVLVLGTGLLIPLLYAALTVMSVQSASFAATSAARAGARAYVVAATPAAGLARARASSALVLADAGITRARTTVACVGRCLATASRVDVTVRVDVPLPLLPGDPTVTVSRTESMPVDSFRAAP